jgi:cytochrome P450
MPFLDKFPIKSRQEARALVQEFENELVTTVLEQTKDFPEDDDRLISLMNRARANGEWTEQQFRMISLPSHLHPLHHTNYSL